jgi:hypothetical protein
MVAVKVPLWFHVPPPRAKYTPDGEVQLMVSGEQAFHSPKLDLAKLCMYQSLLL